ncbi:MAG: hypothetical protein H7138_17135 [Myxococcales bacterium]|nr:hypothetical protein [Myxococcales bacterium]
MDARRKRLVGIAFVVIIAGLLLFNGYALQRNQTSGQFTEADEFHVRPRSIALVARQNTMETVNTTFAAYHTLRNRIGGKHLVLPARLEAHKFSLERISRLEVELGPTYIQLPTPVVERIFAEATEVLAMEPRNLTGILVEPGATRYVLVLRPEDFGLMVIVPEARYQRERAAVDQAAATAKDKP